MLPNVRPRLASTEFRNLMTSPNYVIEVRNLIKSYGQNQVLKGIDLQVEGGTMLALLGPNGAGKTTAVRILSTLLGLTGQAAAVDELLTGRENLVMMGQLYRLTAASARVRAQELLEEFDLVEAAGRPVKTYSGGMRRRLDLAVSLIAAPPVLFLDEPTTGLDPRSRLAMWDIIKNLLAGGTTILLTTQYLDEADQLADRIVVIDGGKVIAEGTPSGLKSKVGNDRLELTFRDDESFSRAVARLGEDIIDSNPKEFTATVVIKDTNSDVKRALDMLAEAGIAVQSLAVHKPTLDDVFLSLTGKQKLAEAEEVK